MTFDLIVVVTSSAAITSSRRRNTTASWDSYVKACMWKRSSITKITLSLSTVIPSRGLIKRLGTSTLSVGSKGHSVGSGGSSDLRGESNGYPAEH